MIILCSGEGISDLGVCDNEIGNCDGTNFRFGPISLVVDGIVSTCLGYSPREVHPESYRYYSESALAARAKARKGFSLTGKKRGVETGYFHINAWMLGEIALELEAAENDSVAAFLFRDTDGTNSSPRDLWERKTSSIEGGFIRADFHRGVPIVPRPKSESWFLCATKQNPYQHCAALEDLPGNDDSPNSAKRVLAEALGADATAEALVDWLDTNGFDPDRLAEQMPSFSAFLERARSVLMGCLFIITIVRKTDVTI
ncbi:hypothetical protein V0R50_13355 [Pseudomonas sp. 148P]|uniref:Uncharacterized protein n=1 Tax=Pseudomonas ulcerans TaxID=3115852 RepID=A0ABU7HRR6_9PSED|nr:MULTISPECIES: hypothetical protein [unclassified Pseudomonas]MEE1922126.1 hypothetical protein [Pseudomonas sp. 147P]MEE1934214.1 hypothetical protein [Pseudomonas sp. 148P]